MVGVTNVFSWDILLLPKHTCYMMKKIKNSFFPEMLFSLNRTKIIPLSIGNWLIWRNFHLRSFEEAANCDAWKDAMKKEYDALIKNRTWRLVDPLVVFKPIGCKWMYKIK